MSFLEELNANFPALRDLLREYIVGLIHENRQMWQDDGVDLTRADIINILGSITRDGNKITLGSLTAAVDADTVDGLHAAAFTSPTYLVTTADANLSAEVVVGLTPGGELGGTWPAPTVDATHSGSAHADYVAKALFDANTILAATADDTPAAVTVAEQRVVGRLTGGNIDDIAIGIADDNIVQIDQADAADNDYAKITSNGLEGRNYAEVVSDIDALTNAAHTALGNATPHHTPITLATSGAALLNVSADYATDALALTPGGYWRCGEASGNLADSSGNSNTATAHGTPTYSVAGAIAGDSNTAVSVLNNNADYFEIANSASVNTGDTFSIIAWVKKAADGVDETIISREANGYQVDIHADNKFGLAKNGVAWVVDSSSTITGVGWHMIAVVKNAAVSTKLYLNGVDVTGTVTDQTIVATAGVVQIGRNARDASNPFNGSLDEIAIFPTALTASQIFALYEDGTTAAKQVLSLDKQAANTVLAGPTTGADAAPAFRAVADADVPATHSGSAHHAQSHAHSAAADGQTLQPLNYRLPDLTELTIADGAITVTQSLHAIDTEADAPTDDLVTINGVVTGQLYLLRPADGARSVVFKHGASNIYCIGNADITLDDVWDFVIAYCPIVGAAVYIMSSDTVAAIATHAAAADPHTVYQKESEKSAVSGYASLDAGTKVPTAELGGVGADNTKYLRGDQSWQVPAGGGGGDVATDTIWATKGDLAVATANDAAAVLPVVIPGAANLLNVLGAATGEDTPTYKVLFDGTAPEPIGVAAAGTGVVAARRNHVHSNTIILSWLFEGVCSVRTHPKIFRLPFALTYSDIKLMVPDGDEPTGASLIVDIETSTDKAAWTTIFSTKPEIDAAAEEEDNNQVLSDTAYAANNYIRCKITQIGSTIAGLNLGVDLICTR